MKTRISRCGLAMALLMSLCCPLKADQQLELSQQDARQLHAFLLTGELLDFGERTSSPSAYLMACELMLDYPADRTQAKKIRELCKLARTLAADDPFMLGWTDRLELRMRKQPRDAEPRFTLFTDELDSGGARSLFGLYDAGWVTGNGMVLELRGPDGEVLQTGTDLRAIEVPPEGAAWWVRNSGERASEFRVLLRKAESPSTS